MTKQVHIIIMIVCLMEIIEIIVFLFKFNLRYLNFINFGIIFLSGSISKNKHTVILGISNETISF